MNGPELSRLETNWHRLGSLQVGQRYHRDLELRLKIVEKYKVKPIDNSARLKCPRAQAAPIAVRSLSGLATKQERAPQTASTATSVSYLGFWLRSGKNLDFCLLAVCSCVLSLLCHQTITSLPSTPTIASGSAATTVPVATPSRIDLVIKAGLFTTSSQTQKEKD